MNTNQNTHAMPMMPGTPRPLMPRTDALRMVKTLTEAQMIHVPGQMTRRVQRMPVSALASYLLTPKHKRTMRLVSANDEVLTLRFSADRN